MNKPLIDEEIENLSTDDVAYNCMEDTPIPFKHFTTYVTRQASRSG